MTSSIERDLIEMTTVSIRFAGDSGDGMQLTGTQFTDTSAFLGNDIATLPDFPAEIRAPAGTLPGVSGFQVNFSSDDIRTPGDEPDVLVVMNPAALKVNLVDLPKKRMIVANQDAFVTKNLKKAGYDQNPLEDGSLNDWKVVSVPINTMAAEALKDMDLPRSQIDRSKNFFALGMMFWLFDRPLEPTLQWIQKKFKKVPTILESNSRVLKAGYYYAETAEIFSVHYTVKKANLPKGVYRKVTGNEASALGLITAAFLAKRELFFGSYPITPASDILHELSKHKNFKVKTFQAEDEIAAMGSVVGASFAGDLAVTGTSGPGIALKSEAIGLGVMTELPMVIVNVQRGGPSTGLPTKTEQADLLQCMYGRNGECPVVIIAPQSPADCFDISIEAVRLAFRAMTPVIILSDGYLANGSEPWNIPSVQSLPNLEIKNWTEPETFQPYLRDPETLARPWAIPGTPGLEHRVGGLEKKDITGEVSYDFENHQHMVKLRAEKIQRLENAIPDLQVVGDVDGGDLLVLGWGSTYGSIATAVENLRKEGLSVSSAHLRYIHPFPKNLGNVLKQFKQILIPEMNLGQLSIIIRAKYLIDVVSYPKIKGRPFMISEIQDKIYELLKRGN